MKLQSVICALVIVSGVAVSDGNAAEFKPLFLVCHETEDTTKADDVYLTAKGKKIWGEVQMNDGDKKKVMLRRKCTFTGEMSVGLFDSDFPDGDDPLGDLTVYEPKNGPVDLSHDFRQDGAHYTLTYRVIP